MPKKKVYRAGVIPYFIIEDISPKGVLMLFMKPSNDEYGGKVFQIGKGKYEEGETAEEAGFREASEELGLLRENVKSFFDAGTFLGRTTIFAARVKDLEDFGPITYETEETVWWTLPQFLANGRELHKSVVRSVYKQILKQEGII